MLTHFGTVFAVPHLPSLLTQFNTINIQKLLLNFHKKMFHVKRWQVIVSRENEVLTDINFYPLRFFNRKNLVVLKKTLYLCAVFKKQYKFNKLN